jgi:hypothetical protein
MEDKTIKESKVNQPQIAIGCVANLYSRQMHFVNVGDTEIGHTHPFDHLSLLASGSVRVKVNGKISEFKAPHMIYIKAEDVHELTALEPNTLVYCIHALRDGNGVDDILDPKMIPNGVNALNIAKSLVNTK